MKAPFELRRGTTIDAKSVAEPDTGTTPAALRRWFSARCKSAIESGGRAEGYLMLNEAAVVLQRSSRQTVRFLEWHERRYGDVMFDRDLCTLVTAEGFTPGLRC